MDGPLKTAARFAQLGFEVDLMALPGARIRCGTCDREAHASECRVACLERFEGDSNPDDESILLAVVMPCGHRGQMSAAYGPSADSVTVDVFQALPPMGTPTIDGDDVGGDPACWAHLFDDEAAN